MKVAPPTDQEINLLKLHQVIISPIHLPTLRKEYIEKLSSKKVTAIAFEYIKDEAHSYPIVRAMSEIAGSTALLLASEYLSNTSKGKGVLLGGITGVPPAKVVIIGAGVVGEFASRTALGLGAEVFVFDNNIYKLIRLQNNIGRRVFTSVINPAILGHELQEADVAVGAIHSGEGRSVMMVTEDMVSRMKAGSVIIDVSIDQGGIFETSKVTNHDDPVFKKYDVIHYCVPNIPSRVSRTASYALSSILTNLMLRASEHGGIEKLMLVDECTRHGAYLYKGHLTNKHFGERFAMKFTDLNLIFDAGM
jgi:alanine dehydrogenase